MSSVELGLQVNTHPSNLALSRFLVTVLKNMFSRKNYEADEMCVSDKLKDCEDKPSQ